MSRLLRVSYAFILAFSWLLVADARGSVTPLEQAQIDIAKLDQDILKLTDQTATQALLNIAHTRYDEAVLAKNNLDTATLNYDNALQYEATALSEKTAAQSAVDGQTATVATALTNKNNAQDELDVATINLNTANSNLQSAQAAVSSAGSTGLQYTVYHLARQFPNIAVPDAVICTGVWNSASMNLPVCGYYENIIVKFTGTITVPSHWTSTYFAGHTDDGFRMYVNGSLAVNNWVEQGARWSPMSPVYDVSEDKTLDVEIWWYNGGGPGSYLLGWAIPGGWTTAGCDYTGGWGVGFSCNLNTFSYGTGATQQQLNNLTSAQQAQAAAQQVYNTKLEVRNDKLSVYNSAVSTLNAYNQTLAAKTTAYDTAVSNTATALTNKNNATATYDQAIVSLELAVDNAQEEYNKQYDFEEKQRVAAAIASALANQPQPEPSPEPTSVEPEPSPEPSVEPSIEPTPEPTPEQTEPSEPTPTPEPETTNEPTPEPSPETSPTPEPSEEPSPQPTDIDPTPEPEPTQDPSENVDKTENTPVSNQMANLIADLTNSNTLTKLTPEQAQAVSKVLGISTSELNKVAELAKSDPVIAEALQEFGDRANENLDAPMPYTLADATTELQTEAFLADPLGAVFDINPAELLSNFSELGMDMTDDQREKAQEVIIPVVLVSNIVSAVIGLRR